MTLDQIKKISYIGAFYKGPYVLYQVCGADAKEFLQGQTTNNINVIADYNFQTNLLTSVRGQLQALFAVLKDTSSYYLVVQESLATNVIERLNQFIIMEDVELKKIDSSIMFILGTEAIARVSEEKKLYHGHYFGDDIAICIDEDLTEFEQFYQYISDSDIKSYSLAHNFPVIGVDSHLGELATSGFSVNYIDFKKGCFQGQETLSKIYNNRGAAKFPCWIKPSLNNSSDQKVSVDSSILFEIEENYLLNLKREHRVEGKPIRFKEKSFQVTLDGLLSSRKDIELYDLATSYFTRGDEEQSEYYFKLAILANPSFADAYEGLGVLMGRQERFDEAVAIMHELARIDENSVMAHTNLSMYYMRLGKIDMAEEEKTIALTKQMEANAREMDSKSNQDNQAIAKLEELKERQAMFEQVLEIDPEDEIALNGMGEVYLSLDQYRKAQEYLEKVIAINPKHSIAYLNLSRALMAQGQKPIELLKQGVEVASLKGEMMPANQMQAMLNSLDQ